MDSSPHFNEQYERNGFFTPKNIGFAVYDKTSWLRFTACLRDDSVVADLGAGGGTVLWNLASSCRGQLIAVDGSAVSCDRLRVLVPGARIVQRDVTRTGLNDQTCDAVVSTMTIEHVDDRAMILEIRRLLKPGGFLFISSVIQPHHPWYFYRNARGERVLEPSHVREYTAPRDLTGLLEDFGFEVLGTATPALSFPLVDPFIKIFFGRGPGRHFRHLLDRPWMEALRLISRVPLWGYRALEVFAKKR